MNDEYLEFWDHYNKDKFKLGVKILSKKNKFIEPQVIPYDQINDIRSLTIVLLQIFLNKINILDYGGSLISFANLYKINQRNFRNINFSNLTSCDIYNPHINFLKNKKFKKLENIILKKTPIKFIKKIRKKNYDIILFGSVIQYVKNLKDLNYLFINKPKFVLITHTPLSINNRVYTYSQGSQNIPKYIHSLKSLKNNFLESKYNIVYISNIDPKLSGLKKNEYLNKIEYLNILLKLKK